MRILSMRYTIHILESEMLNHNVKRFRTDKPGGFAFEPGQATELSLPREKDLADDKHPFTFTSLPEDSWLEFTIKIYPEHEGLTDRLRKYGKGDVFEIGDAWGAITYKGPGLFLAGGAGVTPFLAILRQLDEQGELDGNALWFSNKKSEDIFLADELRARLGDNLELILTEEKGPNFGRIDRDRLADGVGDPGQYYYICGPDEMVSELAEDLKSLDVPEDHIVTEDL